MDKLLRQASNFSNKLQLLKGEAGFPDGTNITLVGRGSLDAILEDLGGDYTSFTSQSGYDWVSVFGVSNVDFPKPENAVIRWDDEDETDPCNTCPQNETIGREEWAKLFPDPLAAPFKMGIMFIRLYRDMDTDQEPCLQSSLLPILKIQLIRHRFTTMIFECNKSRRCNFIGRFVTIQNINLIDTTKIRIHSNGRIIVFSDENIPTWTLKQKK